MSVGPIPLPMMMALGAGAGAITNKKDPLKGAALGALGGFAGAQAGPALSSMFGASASAAPAMGAATGAVIDPTAQGVAMQYLAGNTAPNALQTASQMSGISRPELAVAQASMNGAGPSAVKGGLLGGAVPQSAKAAPTLMNKAMKFAQVTNSLGANNPQPAAPAQPYQRPEVDFSDLYRKKMFY